MSTRILELKDILRRILKDQQKIENKKSKEYIDLENEFYEICQIIAALKAMAKK